eukprot:m.23136 g.23136  ORF g.23136 m.23136 type:complete len:51 (+) comp14083_c0_seq1:78-230(+)
MCVNGDHHVITSHVCVLLMCVIGVVDVLLTCAIGVCYWCVLLRCDHVCVC